MKPFLKDNREERQANRKRGWFAAKVWMFCGIVGALTVTVFGNWNTVGTTNVFIFYMVAMALIIQTTNSVVGIWSKKK